MNINTLVGKTIVEVRNYDDELYFETSDSVKYRMYHSQDCCESVSIDDICGDLSDLIGEPVLEAYEHSVAGDDGDGSYTYTFYKIDTKKVELLFVGMDLVTDITQSQ